MISLFEGSSTSNSAAIPSSIFGIKDGSLSSDDTDGRNDEVDKPNEVRLVEKRDRIPNFLPTLPTPRFDDKTREAVMIPQKNGASIVNAS